ncbi:MAG: Gfo/Idh/MocA family oxidoreductase [Planctomycetota bacterium]
MTVSANPTSTQAKANPPAATRNRPRVETVSPVAADLPPVRLGVLGLGFGLGYFREYIGEDRRRVDIRAVCDTNPERLAQGTQAFGCAGYGDLEAMLRDPKVDVVGLFSAPHGRAGLIDRCVEAGKHVMTTKPLELDPVAIESTLRRAKAKGRHVLLNSPSPVPGDDICQIRRWQTEYNLGELVFARTDCWYQRLESADGFWYDDPDKCPVAPILRLGIYGLNDILALNREVADVQVAATRMKTGRPTPDVAQMTLTLGNGAIATLRATWRCRPQRDLLTGEFVFENGVVQRTFGGLDHWDRDPILLTLRCEDDDGSILHLDAEVPHHRSNCAYRWDVLQRLIAEQDVDGMISLEQTVASVRVLAELKARYARVGMATSD